MDDFKIVDLKKEEGLVKEYIALRNKYTDLLLTNPVNFKETLEWLKKTNTRVKVLVKDDVVEGVVILYPDRNGEVAFFSRSSNKGAGTRLLEIVEDEAKSLGMDSIWAFVLKTNAIAQHVFEKCGFKKEGEEVREFNGLDKPGFKYIKNVKGKTNA